MKNTQKTQKINESIETKSLKPGYSSRWVSCLIKEGVLFVWLQMLILASFQASPIQANKRSPVSPPQEIEISKPEILKQSQISYRAEGGFTGIISYGVIISCVKGKISVLKSIHDPRLAQADSRIRQISKMSQNQYLELWNQLNKLAAFQTPNAPDPKLDILDEFTLTFNLSAGEKRHSFQVYGISRPEASRHFALKNLIDSASQMDTLMGSHHSVAKK